MGRQKFLGNKRGQVALIMIFVTAVALIFYAMSANVSRLSMTKLQLTIAGNQMAAGLASRMASYGEKVMQSNLGGKREKCDWNGLFQAFICAIIIIIIVVIMVVTCQYELVYLIEYVSH